MINIWWLLTIVFIHVNERTKPFHRYTKTNDLFAGDVNASSTVFKFKISLHHPILNSNSLLFLFHVPSPPFTCTEDLQHISLLLSFPESSIFSYLCFWSHKLFSLRPFYDHKLKTILINCLSRCKYSVKWNTEMI